jgi:hypothetical protein
MSVLSILLSLDPGCHNGFQAVGMLIVQPQGQAPNVLKHFILTFQEENSRVTRIVLTDDKNVSLTGSKPEKDRQCPYGVTIQGA